MSTKSDTDEVYRLVSFLGLGKRNPQTGQYEYEKARWRWNNHETETTYVADALARFLKPRQAVIISTVEARNAHQERLEDALEGDGVSRICFQKIPKGSSSTEAWQQFDVIRREISECLKGPVALDITHGFRSQPFFAAAVIAFQRAVEGLVEETGADSGKESSGKDDGSRKRTPIRVFYGAFDAGKKKHTRRKPDTAGDTEKSQEDQEEEIPEAPIWELTEFVTVLDWALALHLFLKTGRAEDAAR
ncbi:MAG: CRISPR-associated DxTHG motif protein, partial [Caldilineae bacterium]